MGPMGNSESSAPLVSVIIPAYQVSQYIAGALDSVLTQSFKNYEIIVVNDGSPDSDDLERVLEPYRHKIIYIRQENQGLAGARNSGIRAAHGQYIAPLDADDIWEPNHLQAQLEVLRADPSIDVVYADARIFGNVRDNGRTVMELCPSEGEVTFERLISRQCTVHICVCVIRRDTLVRVGLFDPAFRRNGEDIDLWLRIVGQGGRIVYQRRVLGRYRRQGSSMSADRVSALEAFLAVLAKAAANPNRTASERGAIERQCRLESAQLSLEKSRRAFLLGDTDTAMGNLVLANAYYHSAKLALVGWILPIAPQFLRRLYRWRDRHIYKLKPEC
jgi:glycosyltransferase involved in cell wall biosynthesis